MTEPSAPSAPPPADPRDVLGGIGDSWIWALAFGVVTLVTGILVLSWPEETLHVLAVVVGIQFLLAGLFRFVVAFARRDVSAGGRVLQLFIALAAVLAGVLCLRNPLQTITALSLIVGAYWLISGLVIAFAAIAEPPGVGHRGLTFAAGALRFVAGIVVLAYPVNSAVALARLLGLWLVLLGVIEVAMGFALSGRRRVVSEYPDGRTP